MGLICGCFAGVGVVGGGRHIPPGLSKYLSLESFKLVPRSPMLTSTLECPGEGKVIDEKGNTGKIIELKEMKSARDCMYKMSSVVTQ